MIGLGLGRRGLQLTIGGTAVQLTIGVTARATCTGIQGYGQLMGFGMYRYSRLWPTNGLWEITLRYIVLSIGK